MLVSLLTRLDVGLAACGLCDFHAVKRMLFVLLQTHFPDPRYQLTASEKRNMRAIFRSRVWNWLEEQCKDFQNCRPWLAFKRLLSEHDRHTCADLPETIWFTTAVNDWIQFCNGNLPLVREACPHMEEFFQCVTPPDGNWTQADLPDRSLIPLSHVAGNILSLNAVFHEHWLVPQAQQDMFEGGGLNLANQPANAVHNEVDYGQVVAQEHVQGFQNEQVSDILHSHNGALHACMQQFVFSLQLHFQLAHRCHVTMTS